MSQPSEHEFLCNLMRDLFTRLERMDERLTERIDTKLDGLERKLCDRISKLQEWVDDKYSITENRLDNQSQILKKHESYVSFGLWILAGGAAVVSGFYSWLLGVFGK